MTKKNKNKEVEAAAFAVGGAVAGAATSATIGGMGLAFAGTAIGIGMFPVAVAGAALGMAAYGVKKAIEED